MLNLIKNISMTTKILLILAILVVSSFVHNWYFDKPTVSTKVYTQAPVPAKVQEVPKKTIETKIKVYDKAKLKKKIELPAEADEEETEVADVVETPKTKTGMTVVTTVDKTTGEFKSFIKEKPLPFFGFENDKRIGVGYSVNSKLGQGIKVEAAYKFLRLGSASLSVKGDIFVNTDRLSVPPAISVTTMLDYEF